MGCSANGPTRVLAEMRTMSEYNPDAWKCSRGRYSHHLRRLIARLVPASHQWVLFSYIFSWHTVESSQILHLCREWNETSVGSGADMVVVRPTAKGGWQRDFLWPLMGERSARASGGCFNSHVRQVPVVVQRWLAPWDYSERALHSQHKDALGAMSHQLRQQIATAVHPLDMTEAIASASRHNATTRIRFTDHIHLNPVGRRFTAQIMLNLIWLLLPRKSEG